MARAGTYNQRRSPNRPQQAHFWPSPPSTMPYSSDSLQELDGALSRLSTKDDKTTEVLAWIGRDGLGSTSTSVHSPGYDMSGSAEWAAFLSHHGLSDREIAYAMLHQTGGELPAFLPLSVPCAYVNPAKADECLKSGSQACSGCRLVKYCSKVRMYSTYSGMSSVLNLIQQECQHKHWKLHSKGIDAHIACLR